MKQLRLAAALEEGPGEPVVELDPKLRAAVVALMAQALVSMHQARGGKDDDGVARQSQDQR